MKKTNWLINSRLGNAYTVRFLKSKHVNMVSETDYIARLKCVCKATFSIPIQFLWFLFFVYASYIAKKQLNVSITENSSDSWLYEDQLNLLNLLAAIQIYHLVLLSSVIIVMLNLTIGKSTTIFTTIFNALYILELLFYASLIFIFDWAGLIHKFGSFADFLTTFSTQWIWILAILIGIFSFAPLKSIFTDINMWNREWIRIDRYRKTEDRENAFIFKTWVSPGEIKARILMILTGWFCILTASIFQIFDSFITTDFLVMKYLILVFGYFVFISSYVIPYNIYSVIFYWFNFILLFGLFTYGLYIIENVAWQDGQHYKYLYLILFIPFITSLRSAIYYTWSIKGGSEIKAVTMNLFENEEDFENFLEDQKIKESEDTI
ncbi:hypothetical protein [Spiroplasma turonicum]|uniref:Transmembrane protein n=1 Tax=Spiroplasma turonicum TaxID=216946 RepID=A0A0K1P6N5_9MOLU|nr:hypothetical protein [Spiroplasma turonicum]AKU79522.1 hypothetical protein STURON_00276 [Spiroplasma turonicum]ALX70545.1 hypothetical protein STURO_v1c02770 [Spiroplasma turonicum]